MPNYGRTSNREAQRSWCLGIVVAAALFLGCFSACQPSAAQSQSRGREALRSGDYAKAKEHFEARYAALTILSLCPQHCSSDVFRPLSRAPPRVNLEAEKP